MSTPKFPGSKKTFEQVVIGDPSNNPSTPELIVNGTSVLNGHVFLDGGIDMSGTLGTTSGLTGVGLEVSGGANFQNYVFIDTAANIAALGGVENVSIATDTGDIVTKGTITATTATTSLAVEDLAVDADGSDATAVDVGGGNLTIDGTNGDLTTAGGITVIGTAGITGNVSVGDATTTAGVINLGDGVTSAADIVITGGGGITGATGVFDVGGTTPGAIAAGDASTTPGLLQLGNGTSLAAAIKLDGGSGEITSGDASTLTGIVMLGDGATSATNAVLSGLTGYTSPFGALSIVQKTGVVQASTATYVLGATALTADAGGQDIVAGITNPDVPRNVTATANAAGCAGDVVVTGTNWAGEVITDTIALAGAAEIAGVKAFATVTAVHLPPETHAGTDTVSIGVGNCLGLQRPIAAAGDVVEVARKAAADAEYTIEATGTVNVANGTVDQSGVGAIVNDDRFEITYNASTV